MTDAAMKSDIERAARQFVARLGDRYQVTAALLYGSQARGDAGADSDADLAVLLGGPRGDRTAAALDMAGLAFDLMLESGVLVDALPVWEEEWAHPEAFPNPRLLANIRREGVAL
jgi:uncharacterized protein